MVNIWTIISKCDRILEVLHKEINLPETFNNDFREEKTIGSSIFTGRIIREEKKRKTIPKRVREEVWEKYVGELKSMCLICGKKPITAFDFECGHVDANGPEFVENLRPICKSCNGSMGRENLKEFAERYFPKAKVLSTF